MKFLEIMTSVLVDHMYFFKFFMIFSRKIGVQVLKKCADVVSRSIEKFSGNSLKKTIFDEILVEKHEKKPIISPGI